VSSANSTQTAGASCRVTAWVSAVTFGVLGYALGVRVWDFGVAMSLLSGLALMGVAGVVLTRVFCNAVREIETGDVARAQPTAQVTDIQVETAPAQPMDSGHDRPAEFIATPDPEPATGPKKPPGLAAPDTGGADDLKRISGVGPALEKRLNELGIYHFHQIGAWKPRHVTWVNENVPSVNGRASRDKWKKQANDLCG